MPNAKLVEFILRARARGFEDYQIREPLLAKGWSMDEVQSAFDVLKKEEKMNSKSKNRITISLDKNIMKLLETRAKRNMLNLHEQIEDILRRSIISMQNKKPAEEKIDDRLVGLFSRKKK